MSIRKEDQTLATITFQNYFRLYKKLSGMTGTAETEAAEFEKIYKLEIVVIPTNKPLLRLENPDVVYRTEKEKFKAVADDIAKLHEQQQPVLVGTVSIEKSERLSGILQRKGVKHVVLNAKFHEREAEIVAQAGRLGMVTISTNMAGRGTDILLGGNPEFMARQELVKKNKARAISVAEGAINPMAPAGFLRFYYQGQEFEIAPSRSGPRSTRFTPRRRATEHEQVIEAGGLFILGTERHESRRIDNQLRGRAGRQGDPGESRFYLSLEDDLMRIFAKQWMSTMMERMGMKEDEPIESKMITKRIEGAQKAVEAQNFEIAQAPARVRRRDEQAARGGLRAAAATAGGRGAAGADSGGLCRRNSERPAGRVCRREGASGSVGREGAGREAHRSLRAELASLNIGATGINPQELSRHELGEAIFEKLKEQYEAKEKILSAGDHALPRADGDAERDRRAVEGSSALDGPPEGRDRSARLCAAGSAGGVQARVLRHVRGHDAEVPGGHGPVPLPDADSGPDGQPVDAAPQPQANGSAGAAGGQRGPAADAGCGAARDCDFDAPALDDHRRAGEGVPAQEAAGAGGGQPVGRRREPAHAAPDRREGGAQRSLPLRQREEVQEVPRGGEVALCDDPRS